MGSANSDCTPPSHNNLNYSHLLGTWKSKHKEAILQYIIALYMYINMPIDQVEFNVDFCLEL